MGPIGDLDELGRDSELLLSPRPGGRADRAVEHVIDAESSPELRRRLTRPGVLECAASGHQAETRHPCEPGRDLLAYPGGEGPIAGISHAFEWQHRQAP